MQRSVLLVLLVFSNTILFSQNGHWQTGATETGQGNASAGFPRGNVMFHNVGTLALVPNSSLAFGYDYRSFVAGLNNVTLQYLYKGNKKNYGLSLFKSGDNIYNEFVASAGIAQQLGIAGLGVKLNYYQNFSEAFGYHRAYSISAGGIAELFEGFYWGTYIENAFQLNNTENRIFIPVLFSSGVSYAPAENFTVSISGQLNIDERLQLKTGLEYAVIPQIKLRTGVNWYYKQTHYGIGLILKKMVVNYAYTPLVHLGNVHSVGLQLNFNAKVDD